MGILLTILGIIGKVLLVILIILLILIAVVLFVPVRYRGDALKAEAFTFRLDAGWLMRLLNAAIRFNSGSGEGVHIRVRIAGFTLYDNRRGGREKPGSRKAGKEKQPSEKEKSATGNNHAGTDTGEESQDSRKDIFYIEEKAESPEHEQDVEQDKISVHTEDTDDENASDSAGEKEGPGSRIRRILSAFIDRIRRFPDKAEEVTDRIDDLPEKIWDKIASISDRISRIDDRKEKFIAFAEKEDNRIWIDKSLLRLKKLLIYLFPDFDRLYIHFGFSDPSLTGKVMGAFSLLYPLCMESLELTPEFDEKVMEGEARFHGQIRVIMLLIYILPVVLNKRFFRIIKQVRKH